MPTATLCSQQRGPQRVDMQVLALLAPHPPAFWAASGLGAAPGGKGSWGGTQLGSGLGSLSYTPMTPPPPSSQALFCLTHHPSPSAHFPGGAPLLLLQSHHFTSALQGLAPLLASLPVGAVLNLGFPLLTGGLSASVRGVRWFLRGGSNSNLQARSPLLSVAPSLCPSAPHRPVHHSPCQFYCCLPGGPSPLGVRAGCTPEGRHPSISGNAILRLLP